MGFAEIKALPPQIDRIVLDEGTIARRVSELARAIAHDYQGKELVVVGILKGASMFTCDLVRHIPNLLAVDFIAITQYSPAPTKGVVRILKDFEEDILGRDVLLIEDIVDTGLTLNYLVRLTQSREPASLSICTLLDRPDLRLVEIPIRYVGFQVDHEFLVGYGLDYQNHFRNLPYVATMKFEVEG